jgi:hypothetical protein
MGHITPSHIISGSLDDCSAQVFPYNIFAYCSIYRVDCKSARNKKKVSLDKARVSYTSDLATMHSLYNVHINNAHSAPRSRSAPFADGIYLRDTET